MGLESWGKIRIERVHRVLTMCMLIPDARSGSGNGNAQLLMLLLLRVLSTILLSKTTMLRHFHLCFSVTVTVTILRTSFFLSHVYMVTCTHTWRALQIEDLKYSCLWWTNLSAKTASTARNAHKQTFRHWRT